MDPASIISLITFSAQVTDLIAEVVRTLYQAPHEILSLHNEISDLRVVLIEYHAVQPKLQRPTHLRAGSENFDTALEQCMIKVQSLFDELADLTSKLFSERSDGQRRFQRLVWLRKKVVATQLRLDLAAVRQNLRDVIGIATISSITKIELRLDSLSNISASSDHIVTPTDAIERFVGVLEQNPVEDCLTRSRADNGPVRNDQTPSTVVIESYKRLSCNLQCACSCHVRYRARNPVFLDAFLGILFIGYIGLPALSSSCDFNICRNSSVRAFRITYTFPSWFIKRTMDMALGFGYLGEPEFNIKLRNRVVYTSEHSIFQLSRQGRVAEMKTLFEKRLASPNDISHRGGLTALNWALQRAASNGDLEPCNLLVAAGLDLDLKDDDGRSSAELACEQLLVPRNPAATPGLASLLSKVDIPELLNFTHLHKVVLEILPLDLPTQLKKLSHRSHINACDSQGRTPLCWAALRGNSEAVQMLLLAGADQHVIDVSGFMALHFAVMSGNVKCVDLLLIAGADVNAKINGGENVVGIAAWANDSPEMVRMLVAAGADFMNRNNGGVTPLQSTVCLNYPGNAETLLSLGADVNEFDSNGDTPFFEAIYYGCLETIDVLLNLNIDYSHRNKSWWSALHVLALYGNLEIFNRISPALTSINTSWRDCKGRTALEAIEDRPLIDEDFRLAFQDYLRELELTRDDDSKASFASALEFPD